MATLYLPMSLEVLIASNAAHIGAIQVPIFSGFRGAGRRLTSPTRRHEWWSPPTAPTAAAAVPMKEIVDEAAGAAPSVQHVVVWPIVADRDADDREAET